MAQRYTLFVAATTAAGFDSPTTKADSRHQAAFLRPLRLRTPLWVGLGGGAFGLAGSLSRSVNLALCPPTPIDSGERCQTR